MWAPRYFALASRNAKQPTAPHIRAMPVRRARRAWAASKERVGSNVGGKDDIQRVASSEWWFNFSRLATPYSLFAISPLASIQRLQLYDRRPVVAADPQHRSIGRGIDEDAPHVGRARQQILHDLVGLRIEPRHLIL